MFKAEFFPDNIGPSVAQLVGHPSFDSEPLACSCDCPPISRPCDLEQPGAGIGREIPRQNQLSLRTKVQRPALAMVTGLVIDQFCGPNISSSIHHAAGEFQQLPGSSPHKPLDVDQIPDDVRYLVPYCFDV